MENSKSGEFQNNDPQMGDSDLLYVFLTQRRYIRYLARRYLPRRYRRALDLEDLVQETFLRMYTAHKHPERNRVRSNLSSIIRAVCVAARRREATWAKVERSIEELPSAYEESAPEEIVATEQLFVQLQRVVDRMDIPAPARDLLAAG